MTPHRATPRPPPPGTVGATQQIPARAPDLTLNKVLAGAGAAATAAVLGSLFGAAGTVTGAALGSVASTVAATLYQRSLDRTRDRLVARVRLTPGRAVDVAATEVTVPMPRVSPEARTRLLRVEPVVSTHRRRPLVWLGATVLVFLLGLLAVTGIEWATGSPLGPGDTGTSVGRVLDPNPAETTGMDPDATTTPEPSPTSEPTDDPGPELPPSTVPGTDSTPTPEPGEPDAEAPSSVPGLVVPSG